MKLTRAFLVNAAQVNGENYQTLYVDNGANNLRLEQGLVRWEDNHGSHCTPMANVRHATIAEDEKKK